MAEVETRERLLPVVLAACAILLVAALIGVGLTSCAGGGEDEAAEEQASEEQQASEEDAAEEEPVYEGPSTTITEEGVACENDLLQAEVEDAHSWFKEHIYDEEAQAAVAEELDAAKDGQTMDEPLVRYNPFGTNSQSLYLYFLTDEAASISYTVSADGVADFTREVADGEASTEHEFQLTGLVPDAENTITLTATFEDGSTRESEFSCDMCGVLGDEELQLPVTEGESDAQLADGLYAVLGNDDTNLDFVYFYDNEGVLRAELPILGYRATRLLFDDGLMYFATGHYSMAAMNELGQIERVYDLDGWKAHHDYVFGEDGTMLILATDPEADSVEDMVISLDLDTGEVQLVLDMGELMPDFKEESLAYHEAYATDQVYEEGVDWIHFNTIQYMGDGEVLLSSRETSSVIKIDDIYGEPSIDYLIGSEEYWEGTDYEDLVLEQLGDFTIHGGQHTVTYVEDGDLEEGQYYLYLFNNNNGTSYDETNDFDYESIGLSDHGDTTEEEGVYSYYYKYLVDEEEGTFELVDSFAVPYSGYVSSVQELGDNVLVDSGNLGVFGEYDEDHVLIRSFSMEFQDYLYRVYKYEL